MKNNLREDAVFTGFFWGMLIGGILAIFNAPRVRPAQQLEEVKQGLLEKLDHDPITDSIADGKAAARRRLNELSQRPTVTPPQ
ncbi:MAG: hypothetical protein MUF87_11235 [Anaerolineae bacterium]|nr:hypothetical protein [Anaerolineae bacterium]